MASKSEAVRNTVVAGMFYPGNPLQLKAAVERFLVRTVPPVPAVCVISPHAGYLYSGSTAGKIYASVELARKLVILCPNHTGIGKPISCWAHGAWQTPLGTVPVDEELAAALLAAVPGASDDTLAHAREHAIEVQLPFLQVLLKEFSIVPLCVGTRSYEELEALGIGLASIASASGGEVSIVVSSDMNHYEDAETNKRKDELALEAIRRLSPSELYRTVLDNHITMCGFAPAVAALVAARALGATCSEVVDYTHSGMVTGDDSEVVSYAGVRIFRKSA